jgi:dolichyl-diphosphooligosaccharide--protein glycosyltransferase
MPRIANQTFTNISGDMYHNGWAPLTGPQITQNMTSSMMFRFCYNNFKRFQFHPQVPKGTDISKQVEVPHLDIKLSLFEEAFTTKNWIIRIYKVLDDPNWNRVY